jgi:hemoglobin/transferrin/lactoferrin receptor protein
MVSITRWLDRRVVAPILAATLILTTSVSGLARSDSGSVEGSILDPSGAPISDARVVVQTAERAGVGAVESDSAGAFRVASIPPGSYVLVASKPGFAQHRMPVDVGEGSVARVAITLSVAAIAENVTVAADSGTVEDTRMVAQQVNVIGSDTIRERVKTITAEAVSEEVGLHLQRTSPSIAGIFVRGLAGKNVAVYVDGVRFTTSAQRGGINTFFDLNDSVSIGAMEVLRGPNSAQYSSDSLGGTVHIVSRVPYFGSSDAEAQGEIATIYSSPTNTFGGSVVTSYGTAKVGILGAVAARRVNTLRPADGLDSHAAVTRFLGLRSDIFGDDRSPDTAFTHYTGTFRLNVAPTVADQFVLHYQRSQIDGSKRYDQMLGGDGNLIADIRGLKVDFGYLRYSRDGLGFFDSGNFTFSFNRQREERVNQGGQGNPLGSITSQTDRTRVVGLSGQLARAVGERNDVLLGADFYHEKVSSPAFSFSPVTGVVTDSRPRIPNGARFITSGAFVQDVFEILPNRVRFSGALRYNVASYKTDVADSPIVRGNPLFPSDSLRVDDVSGRAGIVVSPWRPVQFGFNYSRGFRAPNITDLGTLGLTGDGFEIAFADVAGRGATVGSAADDTAESTGIPVEQLRSETTDNYDLSFRLRTTRFDFSMTGFLIDFDDTVSKQALVLPQGAVGSTLGDQPIVEQLPSGLVFVPLSAAPVLVRTNYNPARIAGFEGELAARLADDWTLEANATYIRSEDTLTGLAPNIEGGTPPAIVNLRLRYAPASKPFWTELYSTLADRQNRLSSLDIADRRTGARRTRSSIAAFFNNGARFRGLVGAGADGVPATGDDVLIPTGESLAAVQSRVLGGRDSAPLFRSTPGYGLVGIRGGVRIASHSNLFVDVSNIADKSHRGLSWGVDGPGRGVTVNYSYQF